MRRLHEVVHEQLREVVHEQQWRIWRDYILDSWYVTVTGSRQILFSEIKGIEKMSDWRSYHCLVHMAVSIFSDKIPGYTKWASYLENISFHIQKSAIFHSFLWAIWKLYTFKFLSTLALLQRQVHLKPNFLVPVNNFSSTCTPHCWNHICSWALFINSPSGASKSLNPHITSASFGCQTAWTEVSAPRCP